MIMVDALDQPVLEVDDGACERGHVRFVRDHQDGDAALGVQLAEQLHDLDGSFGIEVAGRLVGKQHVGLRHDRPGDGDALLLADEPTGNLDSERSVEIMELLTDLNRTANITVLMVTHEPEMAAFARTVIHFKDGLVERIDHNHRQGEAVA